jgi:hypothetical protein
VGSFSTFLTKSRRAPEDLAESMFPDWEHTRVHRSYRLSQLDLATGGADALGICGGRPQTWSLRRTEQSVRPVSALSIRVGTGSTMDLAGAVGGR